MPEPWYLTYCGTCGWIEVVPSKALLRGPAHEAGHRETLTCAIPEEVMSEHFGIIKALEKGLQEETVKRKEAKRALYEYKSRWYGLRRKECELAVKEAGGYVPPPLTRKQVESLSRFSPELMESMEKLNEAESRIKKLLLEREI